MNWEAFTPWSALLGGVLIGGATGLALLLNGRIAGISGVLGRIFRPAPGDAAWLDAHLTDQPLLAFTQPLPRPAPPPGQIPRRYIRCTEGSPSFAAVAARLRADPAWAYDEVPTGHDAMVTEPDALAALLQAT